MPVSCLLSHTYHDLRCPVCGEGFLILAAEVDSSVARTLVKRKAAEALRAHHTHAGALNVHPAGAFKVLSDEHAIDEWHSAAAPFEAGVELVAA